MNIDILNARRVYKLSFIWFEGLDGPEHEVFSMNTTYSALFIGLDENGKEYLFSTDTLFIERLYGLLRLAKYDAHNFKGVNISAIYPIASDGAGNHFLPDKALHLRVNGRRHDKYFEKEA